VVQWLIATFPYKSYTGVDMLFVAIERGHAALAVWYLRSGAVATLSDYSLDATMHRLCAAGQLEVAKALAAVYGMAAVGAFWQPGCGRASDKKRPPATAWLIAACQNFHFSVADWLLAEFKLENDHALAAVYRSCDCDGTHPTAFWLERRFAATAVDRRRWTPESFAASGVLARYGVYRAAAP
jgi:hypothetical protein